MEEARAMTEAFSKNKWAFGGGGGGIKENDGDGEFNHGIRTLVNVTLNPKCNNKKI
jgi:hypothetical protein